MLSSSNSRSAGVSHVINAGLASVDTEVTTLAPGLAPLVLADPVQATVRVVVPTEQFHGVTTRDGRGRYLIDT